MTAKSGRVALVTGAARRIGAGIAERLGQEGYAVIVHTSERSQADAQDLIASLRRAGISAESIACDLGEASACATLVEKAVKIFGPLTLLVNNASVFEDDRIQSFDVPAFDRQVAINLRAPLLLARHFAAQAPRDADASIVNMLDQRVLAPNPLYFSYSVSKAALAQATVTLAQGLAPHVRVNGVAPGPVLPNAHDGADSFAAEIKAVPLQSAPPIAAVADAVAWLAAARHVTGQIIAVDSGQHLGWKTPDILAANPGGLD